MNKTVRNQEPSENKDSILKNHATLTKRTPYLITPCLLNQIIKIMTMTAQHPLTLVLTTMMLPTTMRTRNRLQMEMSIHTFVTSSLNILMMRM